MCRVSSDDDERDAAVVRTSVSGATTSSSSSVQPFQMQVLRNMMEESLEDFKDEIRQDVFNLQIEMLKQFQVQQGLARV